MPTQSGGATVATTAAANVTLVNFDPAVYCQHDCQATVCGVCQWLDHGITASYFYPPA